MPPGSSTTVVESSNISNRRQPVRQTRTQPPKYAFAGGRTLSGRASLGGAGEERPQTNNEPGFFPGLTHFTDSITALPKEMSRHFAMLQEVDAKIYHPEINLAKVVSELSTAPVPVPFAEATRMLELQSQANSGNNSAAVSVNGAASIPMAPGPSQMSLGSQTSLLNQYDVARRHKFLDLRVIMADILPGLEEKNHVIATATDTLAKQLARCESSWPEIEKEISEETRLGNLHHWAYTDRSSERKDARSERPRREAAVHHNFAAVADDYGAVRGTGKRRAQQAQIESEIEETRASKKALGSGKSKKSAAAQATAVGLGLSSGPSNSNNNKRRKIEEIASSGVEMQKSLSAVFGKGGGKGASSPRARSPAGAKRARATGSTTAVNGKGRARAGTGASAANSPLVSSPVVGTFAHSAKPGASPALGVATMARTASSRGRQNSMHSHPQAPTSAPKQVNGSTKPEIDSATPSSKAPARIATVDGSDEPSEARSAIKREESNSRHRPPAIATGTRASGKASKTATPVHASFADASGALSRPRSNRTTGVNEPSSRDGGMSSPAIGAPPKRSHKKGAGIAAQQARALAAAQRHSPADIDDEPDGDGEEKKYCYCDGPSYGDMVGCDGDGCEKEWFHLGCIGLDKVPAGKAKWYCKECRTRLGINAP